MNRHPSPQPVAAVPAPTAPEIRPATPADLPTTARAHVATLPVGLFPSLGEGFVRRWHRTFVDSPHGIALVALDPVTGGVDAFLMGTTDQTRYMRALLGDRRAVAALLVRGVAALLRRPRLGLHFLRTRARPWSRRVLRRGAGARTAPLQASPRLAVLSAVAVHPGRQGRGLGEELVRHFLADAHHGGAAMAELVTDTRNGGACRFYDRLGWTGVREAATRDGHTVRTYRHVVNGVPGLSDLGEPARPGRRAG